MATLYEIYCFVLHLVGVEKICNILKSHSLISASDLKNVEKAKGDEKNKKLLDILPHSTEDLLEKFIKSAKTDISLDHYEVLQRRLIESNENTPRPVSDNQLLLKVQLNRKNLREYMDAELILQDINSGSKKKLINNDEKQKILKATDSSKELVDLILKKGSNGVKKFLAVLREKQPEVAKVIDDTEVDGSGEYIEPESIVVIGVYPHPDSNVTVNMEATFKDKARTSISAKIAEKYKLKRWLVETGPIKLRFIATEDTSVESLQKDLLNRKLEEMIVRIVNEKRPSGASKTAKLIVDCDLSQLKKVKEFIELELVNDTVDGAHAYSRVNMEFDDDDDESERRIQLCTCGGSGECVDDLLSNFYAAEGPDNTVRTETVNKAGIEMIRKHVMDGRKTKYVHTPRELFALLHRSRKSLSLTWMQTQAPTTLLHAAVMESRVEMIPPLLDCALFGELWDVKLANNTSEYFDKTPIQIATMLNNVKMKAVLHAFKALEDSFTNMHRAARAGHKQAMEALLYRHPEMQHRTADPVVEDSSDLPGPSVIQLHTGTLPIYWAVTSGSVDILELMISYNPSSIQSTSSQGETLLTRASALGHTDLVKCLITKHNVSPEEPGFEQKTALQRAIAYKDVSMAKSLLSLGAQVPDLVLTDIGKAGYVSMFNQLKARFQNLNIQDIYGKSPLYYAIENNSLQLAEELVKAGAKVTTKDKQGRNLLHLVATQPNQGAALDFVLRYSKKNIGSMINQQDRYLGNERCFVVRGRDQGERAYHYIEVHRMYLNIFRQVTRAGGAVDCAKYGTVIRSGWGASPPPDVVAAVEREYDVSKVTDRNPEDLTPLNLAILKENYDMALVLLDKGCDFTKADSFGMTPLHMACMRGNLSVVRKLEALGASFNIKEEHELTPPQVADQNQHSNIINFCKGKQVLDMPSLQEFRVSVEKTENELKPARLEEVRAEGLELKQEVVHKLRILSGEIDRLLYDLDRGSVQSESEPGAAGATVNSA